MLLLPVALWIVLKRGTGGFEYCVVVLSALLTAYSSGPAGHTAAIYAARADLKREFPFVTPESRNCTMNHF
jgi:hypothetical protein